MRPRLVLSGKRIHLLLAHCARGDPLLHQIHGKVTVRHAEV